uniref:Uncharacterized protein n=1 Tax=Anguilla anguilla TaxID=7936 RepID=A0A0E9WKQ4_ANGAN
MLTLSLVPRAAEERPSTLRRPSSGLALQVKAGTHLCPGPACHGIFGKKNKTKKTPKSY